MCAADPDDDGGLEERAVVGAEGVFVRDV